MAKEKITVKLTGNNLRRFDEFVDKLRSKINGLDIGLFKFGRIGEEIIITFSVNSKYHKIVVDNLSRYNFDVLFVDMKTSNTQKAVVQKQEKVTDEIKPTTWSDLKKSKTHKTENIPIEELVKTGDYEAIIKIALDQRQGAKKVEEAKNKLDEAVNIAIDNAFNKAVKKKRVADDSLQTLLKIATDLNLKNLHKIDLVKKAGLVAVDLCQVYGTLVGDLVTICTNNRVHSLVTIKAAVALSNKILINPDSYIEEKEYAVRHINIRWIYMAFDIVMKEISQDEIKSLNSLITFLEKERAQK